MDIVEICSCRVKQVGTFKSIEMKLAFKRGKIGVFPLPKYLHGFQHVQLLYEQNFTCVYVRAAAL